VVVVAAAAAAFLLHFERSSTTAPCSKSSSSSTSIGVVSVSDHVSKRNEIPLQVYDAFDCDSIFIPAHGITAVTEQQQQQKRVELKSLASNIT
jgi:BRCT domain type II-containing protein